MLRSIEGGAEQVENGREKPQEVTVYISPSFIQTDIFAASGIDTRPAQSIRYPLFEAFGDLDDRSDPIAHLEEKLQRQQGYYDYAQTREQFE